MKAPKSFLTDFLSFLVIRTIPAKPSPNKTNRFFAIHTSLFYHCLLPPIYIYSHLSYYYLLNYILERKKNQHLFILFINAITLTKKLFLFFVKIKYTKSVQLFDMKFSFSCFNCNFLPQVGIPITAFPPTHSQTSHLQLTITLFPFNSFILFRFPFPFSLSFPYYCAFSIFFYWIFPLHLLFIVSLLTHSLLLFFFLFRIATFFCVGGQCPSLIIFFICFSSYQFEFSQFMGYAVSSLLNASEFLFFRLYKR